MKNRVCCLSFFVFFLFLSSLGWSSSLNTNLENAQHLYQQAVNAKTVAERQEALNESLSLYLDALKDIPNDTYARGEINYNIANTLYMLEEYPWAILYYLRALKDIPTNAAIRQNLETARNKLNIEVQEPRYTRWLEWPRNYPEQVFIKCLFLASLVALLFYGFTIWTKRSLWFYLAKIGVLLALLACYGIFYHKYLTPVEAVAVEPLLLHKTVGQQAPLVLGAPLLAGNTIRVLEIGPNNKWVKIATGDGTVGYVLTSSIRFVTTLE